MTLTFPYPEQGGAARPIGFGCLVCVHSSYCPAFYWFRRYQVPPYDASLGTRCSSWSDDPVKQIRNWSEFDLQENTRMSDEGVLKEPESGGITDPVIANAHEPPF